MMNLINEWMNKVHVLLHVLCIVVKEKAWVLLSHVKANVTVQQNLIHHSCSIDHIIHHSNLISIEIWDLSFLLHFHFHFHFLASHNHDYCQQNQICWFLQVIIITIIISFISEFLVFAWESSVTMPLIWSQMCFIFNCTVNSFYTVTQPVAVTV
jgi:hypothetical protein